MHQIQRQGIIWRRHHRDPYSQSARQDILELLKMLQDETFYQKYCEAYIFSVKDGMEPTLNSQLKKEILAQDYFIDFGNKDSINESIQMR
jgi:hypothetical protein